MDFYCLYLIFIAKFKRQWILENHCKVYVKVISLISSNFVVSISLVCSNIPFINSWRWMLSKQKKARSRPATWLNDWLHCWYFLMFIFEIFPTSYSMKHVSGCFCINKLDLIIEIKHFIVSTESTSNGNTQSKNWSGDGPKILTLRSGIAMTIFLG